MGDDNLQNELDRLEEEIGYETEDKGGVLGSPEMPNAADTINSTEAEEGLTTEAAERMEDMGAEQVASNEAEASESMMASENTETNTMEDDMAPDGESLAA